MAIVSLLQHAEFGPNDHQALPDRQTQPTLLISVLRKFLLIRTVLIGGTKLTEQPSIFLLGQDLCYISSLDHAPSISEKPAWDRRHPETLFSTSSPLSIFFCSLKKISPKFSPVLPTQKFRSGYLASCSPRTHAGNSQNIRFLFATNC